jgi:CBS domain-containing protein
MSIESVSVTEFMTKDVKTETEDQNIKAACKIMYDNNIGSVVIVKGAQNGDKDRPAGIITERDVVRAVGTMDPSLLEMPIREIMSKPVITVSPKNTVKDAIQVMQQRNIRRLIIAENETMVGIITSKDLYRAMLNNQSLMPSLMHDNSLMSYKSTLHDQFGEYWFSDILNKP